MNEHPYDQLPPSAFWRTGVSQENPNALKGIYTKKYTIRRKTKIATAGSCFAQHIARHLLKRGYDVLDLEPPPPGPTSRTPPQVWILNVQRQIWKYLHHQAPASAGQRSRRGMVSGKLDLGKRRTLL